MTSKRADGATEQQSGPRAEIENMKERLLRLHAVSNRCGKRREGKSKAGRRSIGNRCAESRGHKVSPGLCGFKGDSNSGEAFYHFRPKLTYL